MRILVAEDNFTDRLILKKLCESQGHIVTEAANGVEAVEQLDKELPDLILLDAMMPKMDGFEVAKYIRQHITDQYLPIIFITSLSETESLLRCLESGGDDFVSKPFNRYVLEAKLNAFKRTKDLYETIREQKRKIELHSEHLIQEQKIAKRIFDNIAHKGVLSHPNIRYNISPMSIFNGDVLLAAPRPLGGLYVMLGDFTGHGLPAAIGAMPLSDIFFGMTAKGFELFEILKEMNTRLNNILPVGMFCCAVMAEIDFEQNSIKLWNGGLPDAVIIRPSEQQVERIASKHLPLGIAASDNFDTHIHVSHFTENDSLFILSDGVTEAENDEGEMFGEQRLQSAFEKSLHSGSGFEHVKQAVTDFSGIIGQTDDITFIEVTNHPEHQSTGKSTANARYSTAGPSDSRIELQLGPNSLKNFNPLPFLSQHLTEIGNLRTFHTQIMTILTELYSNALEHGVLGLESKLKQSPEGFAHYYMERESRLKSLNQGEILLQVTHENINSGGRLTVRIKDSGAGFDYQSLSERIKSNGALSGRGFPLIHDLASSVTFFDNGAGVEVVYDWSVTEN